VVGATIEENPDAENEHAADEGDACFNQTHTSKPYASLPPLCGGSASLPETCESSLARKQ
jgi:hypothetical protein